MDSMTCALRLGAGAVGGNRQVVDALLSAGANAVGDDGWTPLLAAGGWMGLMFCRAGPTVIGRGDWAMWWFGGSPSALHVVQRPKPLCLR